MQVLTFCSNQSPAEVRKLRLQRPFGFLVQRKGTLPSGNSEARSYFDVDTEEDLNVWTRWFEEAIRHSGGVSEVPTFAVEPIKADETAVTLVEGELDDGNERNMFDEAVSEGTLGVKMFEEERLLTQQKLTQVREEIEAVRRKTQNLEISCSCTRAGQARHKFLTARSLMEQSMFLGEEEEIDDSEEHASKQRVQLDPEEATRDTVAEDISQRGVAVAQVLHFVKQHGLERQHLTTEEVVRNIILSATAEQQCALADVMSDYTGPCDTFTRSNETAGVIQGVGEPASFHACVPAGRKRPTVFFSHCWGGMFMDLVYGITEYFGSKRSVNPCDFTAAQLRQTCWICVFALNHHTSICGSERFPCECGAPKRLRSSPLYASNKFDLVLKRIPEHALVIDPSLHVLSRTWILSEIYEGIVLKHPITCVGHVRALKSHLGSCSVEATQTGYPQDKDFLIARIVGSVGISRFNKLVGFALHEKLSQVTFFDAARFGDWGAVKMMLSQNNGLVEQRNRTDHNSTVVHTLCRGKLDDAEFLRYLIALRGDVNAREDCAKRTPIHLAARGGLHGLVFVLASGGCDLSDRCISGFTALDYVLQVANVCNEQETMEEAERRRRLLRLVNQLVIRPWLPDTRKTKLFQAAARGDTEVLEDMLEADPSLLNERDGTYGAFTVLHMACEHSTDAALIGYLIERKAQINARGRGLEGGSTVCGSWTPLHCAAFRGRCPVIEVLLTFKAHASLTDTVGRTAKDLALSRGMGDAVAMLAAQGEGDVDHIHSGTSSISDGRRSNANNLKVAFQDIRTKFAIASTLKRFSFRGMHHGNFQNEMRLGPGPPRAIGFAREAASRRIPGVDPTGIHAGQAGKGSGNLDADQMQMRNFVIVTSPGESCDFEFMILLLSELVREGRFKVLAVVANLAPVERRAAFLRGTLDMVGLHHVPVGVGSDGSDKAPGAFPDMFSHHVSVERTGIDYFSQHLEAAKAAAFGDSLNNNEYSYASMSESIPENRIFNGHQLMCKVLRAAPNMSVTLLLLSSMRDAARLLRQEESLFLAKVAHVTLLGGLQKADTDDSFEPQKPNHHTTYQVDPASMTNFYDLSAADFVIKRLQQLGVNITTISRYASYNLFIPRAVLDLMVRCPLPNPVVCRAYFAQREHIDELWRRVCVGDSLPTRCSREWFCQTFCDGKGLARESDDSMWDLITRFVVYQPLALVAALPEICDNYFMPIFHLSANQEGHTCIIGLDEDCSGTQEKAMLGLQGYLISAWMRAAGRIQSHRSNVERPSELQKKNLTSALSPMREHSDEEIEALQHNVSHLLDTVWPSLKNSSTLATWRDRDRAMRQIGPPMLVVSWQTIEEIGRVPHSAENRALTLEAAAAIAGQRGVRFFIEMVSHRWACPYTPDFRENTKARALVEWAKYRWASGLGTFFWIDFACIDQSDIKPGVIMLPLYVSTCNNIVCFDSPEYDVRGWCRAERLLFATFVAPNFEYINDRFRFLGDPSQQPAREDRVALPDPSKGVLSYDSDREVVNELIQICCAHWGACWKDGLMDIVEQKLKLNSVRSLRLETTEIRTKYYIY
eukprot:TRINITY_DN27592_c0_g1_i1.p1 TRINITY_DN27592_c0_g1~~TRINITY_DN27592_c0_g1_i1.p1  ORF type:complete len:1631 (-),score=249.87 TRINITY_DN27592_c0_g1_i1:130-4839(-)